MKLYRKRGDLTMQAVEDEMLLLDVAGNTIHQLNASACLVWELCDGRTDEERMVTAMMERYEVDAETATKDIRAILKQLVANDLLEEIPQ